LNTFKKCENRCSRDYFGSIPLFKKPFPLVRTKQYPILIEAMFSYVAQSWALSVIMAAANYQRSGKNGTE
jgi:hypothetical protein